MTDERITWTPEKIAETAKLIEDMARYACSQYMIAKILKKNKQFFNDHEWAREAWQAGHQDFCKELRTKLIHVAYHSDDDHAKIKALEKLFRWFSDKPRNRSLCGGGKTIAERYEALMDNYDDGVITDEALVSISKALKDHCEVLKLEKVDQLEKDIAAIKAALKIK